MEYGSILEERDNSGSNAVYNSSLHNIEECRGDVTDPSCPAAAIEVETRGTQNKFCGNTKKIVSSLFLGDSPYKPPPGENGDVTPPSPEVKSPFTASLTHAEPSTTPLLSDKKSPFTPHVESSLSDVKSSALFQCDDKNEIITPPSQSCSETFYTAPQRSNRTMESVATMEIGEIPCERKNNSVLGSTVCDANNKSVLQTTLSDGKNCSVLESTIGEMKNNSVLGSTLGETRNNSVLGSTLGDTTNNSVLGSTLGEMENSNASVLGSTLGETTLKDNNSDISCSSSGRSDQLYSSSSSGSQNELQQQQQQHQQHLQQQQLNKTPIGKTPGRNLNQSGLTKDLSLKINFNMSLGPATTTTGSKENVVESVAEKIVLENKENIRPRKPEKIYYVKNVAYRKVKEIGTGGSCKVGSLISPLKRGLVS